MDLTQPSPTHISQSRSQSYQISRSRTTTEGGSSGLSPYHHEFQQALVDAGVYPPHYEHPGGQAAPEPKNWDNIKTRLARRRASLSPSRFSEEQHKAFVREDASVTNAAQVKRKVIPLIEGMIRDPRTASGQIPFENLDPIIENENLVSGKPDIFHGARPENLDRQIRMKLERLIVPSPQHDLPIVPTHFTVVKGPDGSAAVAKRQITYDTFFGSRGFHALQNYGQKKTQYDGKAYTIGSIYHNGLLQLFTSHPVPSAYPGEPPSYYMNPLRSFAMCDTVETWREGATWYRNSIEWTEGERDEAIRVANEILDLNSSESPSIAPNTTFSFASIGSQQLGLNSLRMDPDLEIPETPDAVNYRNASGLQDEVDEADEEEDEEDERRSSLPPPSTQPSSRRKRHREDSESVGSIPATPTPEAWAAKKGRKEVEARSPFF